jgi:hypothetical protein
MEELVDAVTVFPDHLEVTVGGVPPINVLYSEAEGVGGTSVSEGDLVQNPPHAIQP